MSSSPPILGIILAGGLSNRMGQDKALLPYKSSTLLQETYKVLQNLNCDELYISRNEENAINDLTEFHQQGPLSGIASCLTQYFKKKNTPTLCLVVPVDMPHINVEFLKKLITYTHGIHKNCFYDKSYLPCCFMATPETLSLIIYSLRNHHRSIHHFLKNIHAKSIPCEYPEQLLNTNTPNEWQKIASS
jgi:molybdopterin-guanine dinucleotide biosynthesis protein A